MPQAAPGAMLDNLTARQLDVLALVHWGLGVEQVARRLHLASTTVKTHLQGLYESTGCHDIHGLAAWWLDHRLDYALRAAARAGVSREELAAYLHGAESRG